MVVVERGALCKCVTFAISTHHNNAAMQFINILASFMLAQLKDKNKILSNTIQTSLLLFPFQIHSSGLDIIAM